MRYGSVCSGIEAASVAWHPLGWTPAWFAEIDAFPSAVLAHHWPDVPNLGDFTTIGVEHGSIELLVGGTPCQSFSVAGLRGGMDDDRGNLALEFCRLADRLRPRWIVWENVPGVLSSNRGRDFGSIVGALGELGYGWSYRILDAQYFGVPQRRRRVFLVGCLGDWRGAAAVLFERHSLSGNLAPSRKARQDVAGTLGGSSQSGGFRTTDLDNNGAFIPMVSPPVVAGNGHASISDGFPTLIPSLAGSLNAYHARMDPTVETLIAVKTPEVASTIGQRMRGQDDSIANNLIAIPLLEVGKRTGASTTDPRAGMGIGEDGDPMYTLQRGAQHGVMAYAQPPEEQAPMAVRRLTPRECERLQGFPDDHTLIPWRGKEATDTNRYKAIGNSMAVPVMAWIGKRIAIVQRLMEEQP